MAAKINTALIDARIEKLRKLRELMDDPETAELLSEAFGQGESLNGSAPAVRENRRTSPKKRSAPAPNKSGSGSKRGQVAQSVVRVMSTEEGSTTQEIADRMKSNGFKFVRDEIVVVNDALRALKRQKMIKASGTKKGNARVKLWVLTRVPASDQGGATPVQKSLLPQASATREKLVEFLSSHGPASRKEIISGTGVPSGSYTYFFRGDGNKGSFHELPDGRWEVAQKHESQPGQ